MGRTQCFRLHRRFKSRRTSLEDDEWSGRPATTVIPRNVEKIDQPVHEDRRRKINDVADVVGLSYGTVQAILRSELNKRRAKFVSRLLTTEQKEHHVEVCQDIRQFVAVDVYFMSRIIDIS
ncbi:protein GVQW3-like [Octopus bimaculoides]|uniref:protein GVQW3-like n=1 Tax=Octopus bimaculoides TaxID=37653 RepID=UPI00071D37EA|nr:protein GVQW3-like [Octopus bimaculoides]|eukprot:XP_014768034.1 PREDICTED: putative uncharacterized protein FLJ37770 [Octopus bimaculoides]